MIKRALILLFLFFPLSVFGGEKLTLNEAWKMANDNDPKLKAIDQMLSESRGIKMSATAPFLPQISGDISVRHYMRDFGWYMDPIPQIGLTERTEFVTTNATVPTYSASLTQMIFDSGKSITAYQSASRGVLAAESAVFAERQSRAVELVDAYSEYYLSKKQLEVAESASHAWEEQYRVAGEKFRTQMVPKTDVLSAEVESANAKLKVREASDGINVSAKKLASIIGEEPTEVDEPKVPAPPDELPPQATRPEVRAREHASESARLEAKSDGLSYLPQIYGRADASYIGDSYLLNKDQYAFTGGVKVPVFDGMANWGKRRAAKARQAKYAFEKQALIKNFEAQADDVMSAWRRSDEEIAVSTKNKEKTTENLRMIKERYAAGLSSAVEVREAMALWQESQLRYYEARCKRQAIAARLRQAASVPVLDETRTGE